MCDPDDPQGHSLTPSDTSVLLQLYTEGFDVLDERAPPPRQPKAGMTIIQHQREELDPHQCSSGITFTAATVHVIKNNNKRQQRKNKYSISSLHVSLRAKTNSVVCNYGLTELGFFTSSASLSYSVFRPAALS